MKFNLFRTKTLIDGWMTRRNTQWVRFVPFLHPPLACLSSSTVYNETCEQMNTNEHHVQIFWIICFKKILISQKQIVKYEEQQWQQIFLVNLLLWHAIQCRKNAIKINHRYNSKYCNLLWISCYHHTLKDTNTVLLLRTKKKRKSIKTMKYFEWNELFYWNFALLFF